MGICDTIVWYWRTIRQELKKGKIYPFFRYWTDRKFRQDIRNLRRLLCSGRMAIRLRKIELGRIHFSHDINYPEWVEKLKADILAGATLPPIKITWDGTKYVVVDGNHRLKAMREVLYLWEPVDARELIGIPVPSEQMGVYYP